MTREAWPLTAAQRGIWLGQALAPDNPIYWTAEALELRGAADLDALQAAIDDVLHATEALRVRYYVAAGEPAQRHVDDVPATERIDLRGPGAAEAYARFVRLDLQTTPALDRAPASRSALVRLDEQHCSWYLRTHHVALDGYSYHLLQREVASRYRARINGANEAAARRLTTLREVSTHDQAYRSSAAFEADRAYWLRTLRARASAEPVAISRGPARSIARHDGTLTLEESARLSAIARSMRVDISAVLLATMAVWLHERTARSQLRLGLAVAGRLGMGCERVPCMAMNVLGVSVNVLSDEPFESLTRRLAGQLRTSLPHQRYRYEDVRLDLLRDNDHAPLFDCVLNWIPFASIGDFPGASVERRTLASGPVEGWAIAVVPDQQRLTLEADPRRFARTMLAEHHAALASIVHDVIDGTIDRRRTAASQSRSMLVGPPAPEAVDVVDALRTRARHMPERPAIEHERRVLSYSELWKRVQAVACALAKRGVGPGARVAVLLPRSPDVVVSQIAVLLAGGTYVPMEPSAPAERIRFMLGDARPSLIVHEENFAALLEEGGARDLRTTETSAEASAYVIYTSGSTGVPRGVEISRGALASFVAAARARYGVTESDRVLQFSALQFDASVEEIYVTLTAGATLVLRDELMIESFSAFHRAIDALRITVLDLPTAYFHAWVAAQRPNDVHLPSALRIVIIGGEAVSADAARAFPGVFGDHVTLLNTYGPTEATVVCSACVLDASLERAPIGTPLPGVTLAVLDQARHIAPRGATGQLCVLGPTLASGYLGLPDQTCERFVSLTVDGRSRRAYLTGDLAFIDDDGQLCFVGRSDDEVKISGHRINPREVEAALTGLTGVDEAAVIAIALPTGGHRLVAFVCASQPTSAPYSARLRDHLAAQAIPSAFIECEALPRDGNGKIDRKRLRAEAGTQGSALPLIDDRTLSPAAQTVLGIFRDLLGSSTLDVHADFFDAGGHSLLALRAAGRVSSQLGIELGVSALFVHRTAYALSEHALASRAAQPRTAVPSRDVLAPTLLLQPGDGPALFCVHPVDGAAWCYVGLAQHLPGVPIVGLQSPGLVGPPPSTFEATVDDLIDRIIAVQSKGPYRLLGWSAGGGLAHAVACGLRERGEIVSLLAMLDSHPAEVWQGKPDVTELDALRSMMEEEDVARFAGRQTPPTCDELIATLRAPGSGLAGFSAEDISHMAQSAQRAMRAYRAARHPSWPGELLYFRAAVRAPADPDYRLWLAHVAGAIEVVDVPCRHLGMCSAAALEAIGRVLRPRLH